MIRPRTAAAVLTAWLTLAGCASSHQVTAVAAAANGGSSPTPQMPATAGPTATSTTVPDSLNFSARTLGGAPFSGASLAGRDVVLWFWAPGCSDCVELAPAVLAAEKGDTSVRFIGVAGLADAGAMRAAAASMRIDGFTQLADQRGVLWRKFGVTLQPAFAFLGRDGKVSLHKGSLSKTDLERRTAALAQDSGE